MTSKNSHQTLLNSENLLDLTAPIRGVPFTSLRTLIQYFSEYGPVRYSEAMELVTNKGIITSVKKTGQNLKKSPFYHYWKALEILGFIELSQSNKAYTVTERGKQLLDVSSRDVALDDSEKAVFRLGMLSSPIVWRNFLSLFTGSISPIWPLPLGNKVSFVPLPPEQLKRSKYRRVSISSPFLDKDIEIKDGRISQLIPNGLRQWGLECDLINEIVPPSSSRRFKDVSEFMYLLDDTKRNLTINNFSDIINKYQFTADLILEQTLRFDIPELLATLCLQEGIALSAAQNLLLGWIARFQRDIALERPSLWLIDKQRGSRSKLIVNSAQPWLVVKGITYTTMIVRQTVFGKKDENYG